MWYALTFVVAYNIGWYMRGVCARVLGHDEEMP
jgi:hypothetical protein